MEADTGYVARGIVKMMKNEIEHATKGGNADILPRPVALEAKVKL